MKEQQEITGAYSVKTEVRVFILLNFLPGEDEKNLQDDDLLFESGIIDSSGAMTLVSFLEDHFGIEILDEELFPENFASIAHIVDFVVGKLEIKKSFQQEKYGFKQ
jgi:acyl carrier protein